MAETELQVRLILERQCREIGEVIAPLLPAGVGFAIVIYDFGAAGNMAYVSNGDRAGMVAALRELIEQMEPTQ